MATVDSILRNSHTSPTGCIIWQGGIQNNGYGQVRHRGKTQSVHRVMYELINGALTGGIYICHTCDTRACINIYHLFAGTRSDNMLDMRSKGRGNNQRLTDEDLEDIRGFISLGVTTSNLVFMFGVSSSTIADIKAGRTWK